MNSDNLILRETDNAPLINKDDTLINAEIDGNFINIYNDFIALSNAEDTTLIYDIDRSYVIGEYATFDGKLWLAIDDSTGVTPAFGLEWVDVFPTILAHEKNKDTILDKDGANETTVAEIRAFIDAGLTSTTNLSLSTKTATSFKIESSTGADVTIPQATTTEAGLLNSSDKLKLKNLSGINSGDQTLVSLNAEDVDNKVTDFTTINDTLYPTTQAVDTYLTAQVPPLVDAFLGGVVAQDLQQVTTEGNTTTDNIEFTGGVGVLFDNTSTLRKGTIDAGYGGAKGIAQICSVGYELKWEAGRLYVMGDGGTTIREVSHNFTTTPTTTDDNTKGFIVGSRWILDNGDLYICSDVTTATAVWTLQTITTADIDDSLNKRYVTDANLTVIGNTSGTNTGDQIISDATISTTDITTNNFTTAKHGFVPKGTNVGNYLKDDGTWAAISAGGLTYFTEAQSTASPNATVNVDSLTAIASTTNADFVIRPKGTGSLLANIPDGTTTGGNKRGLQCVDLQMKRNSELDVATANYSVISGGQSNKCAAGSNHSIGGGYGNYIPSGDYVSIVGGYANSTGTFGVTGGESNVSTGSAHTIFGSTNTSNGNYNCIIGSSNASTGGGSYSTIFGRQNASSITDGFTAGYLNVNSGQGSAVFGARGSSNGTMTRLVMGTKGFVAGGCQASRFLSGTRTTNATEKILVAFFEDDATSQSNNQLALANNSSVRFKGTVIGRQSGSTNTSAWDIDGIIQRGTTAGSTTLLISNVNVIQNTPTFGTPTLAANTTIGCLTVNVTGLAATNIQWSCSIDTTEVIYA